MPSLVLFENLRKPIGGGGLPLFPHDRGMAFRSADYFFAYPLHNGGFPYFEWHKGADYAGLRAWVQTTFGDMNPTESKYEVGTAYKRIYRPPILGSFYEAVDRGKATQSFVALRILLDKLSAIFQTIEPANTNKTAYGHLVRELLLLACMEVESSWAAVLKENNYKRKSFTTNDYVKLSEAMLLDSYCLSLRSYPDFPKFGPFVGWDKSAPTKSLPWYHAYNNTKHDRETNLGFATLENAVHAVGAAVAMFFAQFGIENSSGQGEQPTLVILSTFTLETDFKEYPKACYIPEMTVTADWPPELKPSSTWKLVNYPI